MWESVSVEGSALRAAEPFNQWLKGQQSQNAFSNQEPAFFTQSIGRVLKKVSWTLFKGLSIGKRPKDLFPIDLINDGFQR